MTKQQNFNYKAGLKYQHQIEVLEAALRFVLSRCAEKPFANNIEIREAINTAQIKVNSARFVMQGTLEEIT